MTLPHTVFFHFLICDTVLFDPAYCIPYMVVAPLVGWKKWNNTTLETFFIWYIYRNHYQKPSHQHDGLVNWGSTRVYKDPIYAAPSEDE